MLRSLATFVVRRRVAVLLVGLLGMVLAGAVGGGAAVQGPGGKKGAGRGLDWQRPLPGRGLFTPRCGARTYYPAPDRP